MALFSRGRVGSAPPEHRWKRVLDAALKVSEIASSATALPDALQRMMAEAIQLLHADHGSIMLLDDDGRSLSVVASVGLPNNVADGFRVPTGESIAGRVVTTGRPLLLGDVEADAFDNYIPKTRPINSSVVVPLRVRGRSIGVLNLGVSNPNDAFTEEDLRIAQMFAEQAGSLIHMARLHAEAELRSSYLMSLVESSKGLVGTLDVTTLLQTALDGGSRLVGAREGFACLFDAETGGISHGVFRDLDKADIARLLAAPDVAKALERGDVAVAERIRSGVVAAGFLTSQNTKGILVLGTDPRTAHERSGLLRAFAQQVGLAVGSAELHSMVRAKETELTAIAHGVPTPIVLADARGRIVGVNSAAEELFNISSQFASGMPVRGNVGDERIEDLLLGRGALQSEVVTGNPPRTFKVRVSDVSAPGAVMGRVLMMEDVSSERERMQTQRDFVAMIGHELRTPLTTIKGFARLLIRRAGKASPAEVGEAVSMIDSRAEHLERLIEDLLYVSKIESREASLNLETIDLHALIREVIADLNDEHPERSVELSVPAGLEWQSDATKVGLVLRHLIDNALKYSQTTEVVSVRARADADELQIDIIDKGAGLVSSDIPTIFERFRQVDGSSTREHGGMGVGLYLCRQLVGMLEGRIWVDSTWGKGSTFSFALPRRSMPAEVARLPERRTLSA